MKLHRVGLGVVLTAVVLVATPGTEVLAKRNRTRPFVVRAHVVDFEKSTHTALRRRQRSFDGYETHTLEFDVYSRARSQSDLPTHIKLYLPNGDLYAAVDVEPFQSSGNDSRRRSRPPFATARLRVSGTVITRYGLYGDWRADVCWETGSVTSCQRALNFDIH